MTPALIAWRMFHTNNTNIFAAVRFSPFTAAILLGTIDVCFDKKGKLQIYGT